MKISLNDFMWLRRKADFMLSSHGQRAPVVLRDITDAIKEYPVSFLTNQRVVKRMIEDALAEESK